MPEINEGEVIGIIIGGTVLFFFVMIAIGYRINKQSKAIAIAKQATSLIIQTQTKLNPSQLQGYHRALSAGRKYRTRP